MTPTFGSARDAYSQQASVRSEHTLSAYKRAVDLFLLYLNDRTFAERLPIQAQPSTSAEELPLHKLGVGDAPLFSNFVRWLQTPPKQQEKADRRPYARATIELRLAGALHFFDFLKMKGWLPDGFPLQTAIELVHSLSPQDSPQKASNPAQEKVDMAALLEYYAGIKPPKGVATHPDQFARWELTRLRNQALIHTLAETAGQVSAILDLHVADILPEQRPLTLAVKGKNQHTYTIRLDSALPAMRAYLGKRAVSIEKAAKAPLFVSHDTRYEGKRMSRVIAWRIIQRAARGVGLGELSPHALRHWRAQQLIEQGATVEELKERLGHRSTHTIRVYYGHLLTDPDQEK